MNIMDGTKKNTIIVILLTSLISAIILLCFGCHIIPLIISGLLPILGGFLTNAISKRRSNMKPKVFIDANFKLLNSMAIVLKSENNFRPIELSKYVVRLHNLGSLDAMSVKLYCKYMDEDETLLIDEIDVGNIQNKNPVVKVLSFPVTERSVFTLKRVELSVTYEDKLNNTNCKSIREYEIITHKDATAELHLDYSHYNYFRPMSESVVTCDTTYHKLKGWLNNIKFWRKGNGKDN